MTLAWGKTVLITGGALGMGRELAFLFAREDARIALWDMNAGELDKTDRRLMRCIELAELVAETALETWKWHVARELFLTPQELDRRLEKLDRLRGIRWDAGLGSIAFVS